jgi:hypothetical protein
MLGCSLGYRLYFCVSKPSSGHRLHEAENGSRLTNGSCAMSLNFNHVVLNTQGNLTGDQYIRDVLQPVVVPHFDNHSLATRHVYMDDNARPHRSRAVWITWWHLLFGCNPYVLGWRPQPCIISLQLDVGCSVVIAAAITNIFLDFVSGFLQPM